MVGRGGAGGGEVDEVEDEDEVTLLLLGGLAGGLGVLVLVGLVGGLVVRGRRAPAGQQDYTSVEVRSSSTSLQGEGDLKRSTKRIQCHLIANFFLSPGARNSMQCSVRSSGESSSRGLVPKSDGRGGRGGGGGEGSAFKSKLEIKSSHSSHQRLLGSNSVSLQLFSLVQILRENRDG